MTDKKPKNLIQIIFLGEAEVGKTSIIQRFGTGNFEEETKASMGLDFIKSKYTTKAGDEISVKLWDTAG